MLEAIISFAAFMAIMTVVVVGIAAYQHRSHMRGHEHDDDEM